MSLLKRNAVSKVWKRHFFVSETASIPILSYLWVSA